MPNVLIRRLKQDDYSTTGELLGDGVHICYTLERPWADNQHGISCIPAGTYQIKLRHSNHFQIDLYGLLGVPDRDNIEIHKGNKPTNSDGCIMVGMQLGGEGIVGGTSGPAFDTFMAYMNGADGTLTITDPVEVS